MAETVSIDILRTICAEVPEARVIVIDCCQTKDTLQPTLAAEPVHYILKKIPAEQLADALREAHSEESMKRGDSCSPLQGDGTQNKDKRTVVVLKIGE